MTTQTWQVATARRIGLGGEIDFTPSRIGQTLHIPCARGHIVDLILKGREHPDVVAKMMLNKGWTIGHKLICPDCQRKKKRKASEVKETMATVTEKPTPSPDAKRAHRMVMMLLEEQYDETNKCYRSGWDDARIASESGASKAHVAEQRETYFGPPGMPSEAQKLHEDMERLRDQALAAINAINDGIADVAAKIERLIKANGWK